MTFTIGIASRPGSTWRRRRRKGADRSGGWAPGDQPDPATAGLEIAGSPGTRAWAV